MPNLNSSQVTRCVPKGICSWNFSIEGNGQRADLNFDWLLEQGTIVIGETALEIRKHGAMSGHWTLKRDGQETASAQKLDVFRRTFELRDSTTTLTLRAISALGRSFRIEESNQEVGTIRPDHPLTRRATIETPARPIQFTTLAFAFWLAALMWRRAHAAGGAS